MRVDGRPLGIETAAEAKLTGGIGLGLVARTSWLPIHHDLGPSDRLTVWPGDLARERSAVLHRLQRMSALAPVRW